MHEPGHCARERGMRMRTQTHSNGKPSVGRLRSVPPPGSGWVVGLPEVMEIAGLSRATIWRA